MTRSRLKWVTTIGAAMVVAGFLTAWGAEQAQNVQPAPDSQLTLPEPVSCAIEDNVVLEPTGLIIKPNPGGCLGSDVQTCDDLPIPVGGTCSCESVLLEEKCVNCDTREKGLVLETTCTICPHCWSPPCGIVECARHTSRTCTEI